MAKEEKEKQTITKDEVGDLEAIIPLQKTVIQMTLPELISSFVKKVMEDPKTLNQCGHDLQLWHDSQPMENRKELVASTRKSIETAKLVTEWLFSQYQQISQKDW